MWSHNILEIRKNNAFKFKLDVAKIIATNNFKKKYNTIQQINKNKMLS